MNTKHRSSQADSEGTDSSVEYARILESTPLITPRPRSAESSSTGKPGKLTLYDGFALLVSLTIGSGVFSSPSQVHNHVPSPAAALLVWLLSGVIAWIGATSLAELGAAFPVNGGMQEYLHYMYGDFLAFLVSWIWILAVKPSSSAILCLITAEYWITAIVPNESSNWGLNVVLSLSALSVMVFLNCVSIESTSRLTNIFLFLKLTTVALLLLCSFLAVVFGVHSGGEGANQDWKRKNWFGAQPAADNGLHTDWGSLNTWEVLGQCTTAFYAGLWGYSGWDNANMVAGEMRNPSYDLPKAVHRALPTIITCYILVNISYYLVIPWREIGMSNAITVFAGKKVFGALGGAIFAALVSIACLGSINITVFTSARLTSDAARRGYLPKTFTDIGIGRAKLPQQHSTRSNEENIIIKHDSGLWRTPIKAILLNAMITCIYIVLGSFGALIVFVGIAEYCFLFLTVAGLLRLRFTEPSLQRPYRPRIWNPILFSALSFLLVIRGAIAAPIQSTIIGVLLLAGVAYHLVKRLWRYSIRRWSWEPVASNQDLSE